MKLKHQEQACLAASLCNTGQWRHWGGGRGETTPGDTIQGVTP